MAAAASFRPIAETAPLSKKNIPYKYDFPPISLDDLPYAFDKAHIHLIVPGRAFSNKKEITTQIALNRLFHIPPEYSELFEKIKRDGAPITTEKEDLSLPFEDYKKRIFTFTNDGLKSIAAKYEAKYGIKIIVVKDEDEDEMHDKISISPCDHDGKTYASYGIILTHVVRTHVTPIICKRAKSGKMEILNSDSIGLPKELKRKDLDPLVRSFKKRGSDIYFSAFERQKSFYGCRVESLSFLKYALLDLKRNEDKDLSEFLTIDEATPYIVRKLPFNWSHVFEVCPYIEEAMEANPIIKIKTDGTEIRFRDFVEKYTRTHMIHIRAFTEGYEGEITTIRDAPTRRDFLFIKANKIARDLAELGTIFQQSVPEAADVVYPEELCF